MKEQEDEKKIVMSKLTEIGKGNDGFKVPEGYFEKLPLQLRERIDGHRTSFREQVLAVLMQPRLAYSVMAVIMVLAVVFIVLTPSKEVLVSVPEKISDEKLAELSEEVTKKDVQVKHLENIEQEIILEEITPEEIISSSVEEVINHAEEGIAVKSNEEIEYLIQEDIDLYLIEEALFKN